VTGEGHLVRWHGGVLVVRWADARLDRPMWTVQEAGRQHQVTPCPVAVW